MARLRSSVFIGSSTSRKVELDIILSQFGPLISPDKLRQMKQDLVDLEKTLREQDGGVR